MKPESDLSSVSSYQRMGKRGKRKNLEQYQGDMNRKVNEKLHKPNNLNRKVVRKKDRKEVTN